ncbi:hypothetical protein Y1Q_0015710 [Alligator mississippiensis]|uniref:Uncharacterized protein n=1 Tax=Alligator mississippiensis TaxID=8496 RepID=A0A151NNT0_ALLMI|nr:hypothetical protein Y1Q_0015710 [Alligator mississippiensis]
MDFMGFMSVSISQVQHLHAGREAPANAKDVPSGMLPPSTSAFHMCCLQQQQIQDWTLLLGWLVTKAEEQLEDLWACSSEDVVHEQTKNCED